MSNTNKESSKRHPQGVNGTENSNKAVPQFTRNSHDLQNYRFSATNMMIGLDPMVPRAKPKQVGEKATKNEQKEVATQTTDSSSEAVSTEPATSSEAKSTDADASNNNDNKEADTSSEASGALTPESSSGVDSEAPNVNTSIEAATSTESDGESTPAASTDNEDVISGTISDAETVSTKSVSFAEGTMAPAPSPSSSIVGQPIIHGPNTGSAPWTMSEDAMIISMKDQGADWEVIAASIQRTKFEVRKRYYELKCNRANVAGIIEDATNAAPPSASIIMEPRAVPAEPILPNIAESLSTDSGIDTGYITDEEDNDEEYDEDKEYDEEESEDESTAASFGNEDEDGEASSADELLDLLREDSSSDSPSITDEADGYDASDYDPFADPADPIAHERERRRQERYIRYHAHASMYRGLPQDANSSRDNFASQGFSRRDRALLADIANRRVAAQWLEMQANFFNVTGRMVPLHLIKAKLENSRPSESEIGYLARGERKVANWTDAVADATDMLDPTQAKDAPEDFLRYASDDEAHGHMGSVSDKE
ncbi:hypothetical protein F5X68DRAFT_240130 [Plectosphaerella plurivora]|uniref:Myb-like domain-containing protein n=1 Tax=Plectosphaerella plurivora TaxID=936078 RepID=A0A9P8VAL3_9PEZI|nr:hypothetical protein F5X68DRAFT_240130 [Plectosphaerella plurivora]